MSVATSFNLRHLRYFLAVADAGSFRAASARLNVAQSAMSRRVADLEAIFGVRLFERHSRGIALSDAGTALRRGALRIAAEIDSAQAMLGRQRRGEQGLLRVGLYGTTSQLAFVPRLISALRAAEPDLRLDLGPLPHGDIDPASRTVLDIAFYENRQEAAATLLLAGQYQAALPHNHPLAAGAAIPFAALCGSPLICFPRAANPPGHDALIRAAAAHGRPLDIIHETASECARLALAAAGMGVALVSPLAAHHDQGFAVEYRAIAGLALPFELWLSVRAGIGTRFVETIRDVLTTLR